VNAGAAFKEPAVFDYGTERLHADCLGDWQTGGIERAQAAVFDCTQTAWGTGRQEA
jgi:hypothetical protein